MFDFLKEYDQQSLTRLITVVLLIFFMIVTVYLIYARFNWMNYDIFCLVTVGGGAGTQLVNKWVNSKYNINMSGSKPGKPLQPPVTTTTTTTTTTTSNNNKVEGE